MQDLNLINLLEKEYTQLKLEEQRKLVLNREELI